MRLSSTDLPAEMYLPLTYLVEEEEEWSSRC